MRNSSKYIKVKIKKLNSVREAHICNVQYDIAF